MKFGFPGQAVPTPEPRNRFEDTKPVLPGFKFMVRGNSYRELVCEANGDRTSLCVPGNADPKKSWEALIQQYLKEFPTGL